MKTLLENKITERTCAVKLKIMRTAYIVPELERCRNCENYQDNKDCKNFRPYRFDFTVRRGTYAIG
jgi:hypothetical protein